MGFSRQEYWSGLHRFSKEGRMPRNWTMLLEKTPENLLGSKEFKPVNLKGNQSWILTGRTDAEAEAPVFWSPGMNSWLIVKDPDAGKDWGQKEKRASEDEMAGWHHWCKVHELGQTLTDGEGLGGLACCNSWVHAESDTTGRLSDNSSNGLVFHLCIF